MRDLFGRKSTLNIFGRNKLLKLLSLYYCYYSLIIEDLTIRYSRVITAQSTPKFHLISWCRNIRKIFLSTKFPHLKLVEILVFYAVYASKGFCRIKLQISLKNLKNLIEFKKKIKLWDPTTCTYKICK